MISRFDLSAITTVAAEVPGGTEPSSRNEGRGLIGKLRRTDDRVWHVKASRPPERSFNSEGLR